MTDSTMTGQLEPLAPGQLSLVEGSLSVQDIADKLTAPVPSPVDEDELVIPFPPLPKHVELTEDDRAALAKLPSVFGKVEMTERRVLTPAELHALADEDTTLAKVLALAKARQEAVRETIRHHNDVTAIKAGEAFLRRHGPRKSLEPTPRDHNGHLLLARPDVPYLTVPPGFSKGWRQSFTSGSTSQSLPMLEQLLASGEITKAEYNSFTRETRVLDEDKMRAFMRKNAERGLRILKAITIRKPPNSSLGGPAR